MTIRQQIVDAVLTRLRTITTAAGYSVDMAETVDEWPGASLSPNKLPAAIVTDPGGSADDAGVSGRLDHKMDIEIELIVKGTPAIARALVGDVLKAIGTDPTWSGLAVDSTFTGVQFGVEQREHLFSGAQINLSIMYRTAPWTI